jgi:hypothetical protein
MGAVALPDPVIPDRIINMNIKENFQIYVYIHKKTKSTKRTEDRYRRLQEYSL